MNLVQQKYWERHSLIKRRHPNHPCIKEYVLPKINEIKKIIRIMPETKLLDVGCGNGFFTYYFGQFCSPVGVDYSEVMLRMCPMKNKLIMDASNLAFKDYSFDIVFCHALLHHTENPLEIIKEMARVSREYVIILEPNRNNPLMFLFSLIVKEEMNALRYSLSYLKKIIFFSGLDIMGSFSYGMIMPNKSMKFLLPIFKIFNFRNPLGMTNIVIAKVNSK